MSPLTKKALSADVSPAQYAEWRAREEIAIRYLEDVTSEPREEQERLLKHILEKNATTEYLQMHGLNGATDTETFRKCLPVVDYEAYREMINRIVDGDCSSPILSSDPPAELLVSSGTSSGEQKIFPVTDEDLESRGIIWNLLGPVLNRSLPSLQTGKFMMFCFGRAGARTPSGFVTRSATTSFLRCEAFRNRAFDPSYRLTSPDEVLRSADVDGAMYCHLLCGLMQRLDVLRIGAIFATVLVKAIRCLETLWPEICDDIANGTLSPVRVQDKALRAAMRPLLRSDPGLADLVRKECSKKVFPDGHGIIRRLWPNVEVLDTCITGTMSAYVPSLANLSDNVKVINTSLYACTEGFFGINLSPECPPEEISYTLLPSMAYFEFIPVQSAPQHDQKQAFGTSTVKCKDAVQSTVLDLASLEIGQEYQLLITTMSGFYRLQVGDVLKVVGYHNNTPKFQFMRRMNVVLSVDYDKTDEQELQNAVTRASSRVLEKETPWLRLQDYTSYTDLSTSPGHYVVLWEVSATASDCEEEIIPPVHVLENCCLVLEESLNACYRHARHDNDVGPLELRVVQRGTFDLMFEHAVSRGASMAQYKTPRGLGPKHASLRQILTSRTVRCHFSRTKPAV